MSNANSGAFPFPHFVTPNGDLLWGEQGLTKRERTAIALMQGMLANPGGPIQANSSNGWGLTNCTRDQVAGAACRFADALLEELAK